MPAQVRSAIDLRGPMLDRCIPVRRILGGDTVIGAGAVIGSNAFITSSVPGGTRVSIKNPELQFKDRKDRGVKMTELGQEGFWTKDNE